MRGLQWRTKYWPFATNGDLYILRIGQYFETLNIFLLRGRKPFVLPVSAGILTVDLTMLSSLSLCHSNQPAVKQYGDNADVNFISGLWKKWDACMHVHNGFNLRKSKRL